MFKNLFIFKMNPTKEEAEVLLSRVFGFPAFRRGQWEVIESCLQGKDVIAVMPTGGGKSICYQMMAVLTRRPVMVISPLISLMEDQVRGLRSKKGEINAGCIHSMQSMDETRRVFQECLSATSRSYVLYMSPEKMVSLVHSGEIPMDRFAVVAVDEAHCVSQWGHDFRPEYAQIGKLIGGQRVVMALTASATPLVLTDIIKHLGMKDPHRWIYDVYRPNLYYQVEICAHKTDKIAWTRQALQQTPTGRILVYVGTRKDCEEMSDLLGTEVGCYHAGMTTEERKHVQERYDRGDVRILVATNAFGMGIDHPDVRLVVHFSIPSNIDSLYQEMGRAGRDNEPSTCLLLFSTADKGLRSHFIHQAPEHQKRIHWYRLRALVEYSETDSCRHGNILYYYRQGGGDGYRCTHCDRCDPASPRRIGTPLPVLGSGGTAAGGGKKKKTTTVKKKSVVVVGMTTPSLPNPNPNPDLLAALKTWRQQEADRLQKPLYCILTNKTIEELVTHTPNTAYDLSQIHGIGPKKMSDYGTHLLSLTTSRRK